MMRRLAFAMGLMAASCQAAAADLEAPLFLDIRLMAADLVDELVYEWQSRPPFSSEKSLALVEVVAPVGLDDRFNIMVENRLFELLRANPELPIKLVHCSACLQVIARSTPKGTIIARGVDQPEVLTRLLESSPERLALSVHFEAHRRDLVLRAQIFKLAGDQTILWAKSFSTSLSSRRVLRQAAPLVSLETAREQQRQILKGKDQLEMATRVTIRTFSMNPDSGLNGTQTAPLVFLEHSFEASLLPKRKRRMGLTLGATSLKNTMDGWSAGGQIMQLIGRDTPSLSDPDLYWVVGFHYIRLRGPGALPFGSDQVDVQKLLDDRAEPKATLVSWRLGLETHIKYRYGMIGFLEYIPLLEDSEVLRKNSFLGIPYHNFGIGLVVRW